MAQDPPSPIPAMSPPPIDAEDDHQPGKRKDAFAELMSASKKPKTTAPHKAMGAHESKVHTDPRQGLGVYIDNPEKHERVVEYDDKFVVIRDAFPKSEVHLLLMPRDPELYNQHPLKALSTNPEFLAEVKRRVERLKKLAASELRRQFGRESESDKPYQKALEFLYHESPRPHPQSELDELPAGRDWCKDIIAGVHTHPSMGHLHIHILSRDMHGPYLKHKKHYLSFNSSFFVNIDEFPLEMDSKRFSPGDWPHWDMKCWRCGRNFQNKFTSLRWHLEKEFEEWKRE